MKKTSIKILLILLAALSVLTACPAGCFAAENVPVPASVTEDMFKKRDYNTSYSDPVSLDLSAPDSFSGIKGISAENNVITITKPGCYLLSGTLASGRIVIDVDDDEKVQLVLDSASVTCPDDAAIYIPSADKVFITTVEGSLNTITSNADLMEAETDAAIYSECDLTLNGKGTLTVNCPKGHAIATRDDLKITSGKYELTAGKQGLKGKDSIRIADGEIRINSIRDGMHSEHKKNDKGFIYIGGGKIDISAGRDGIYASNYIIIADGKLTIESGNGSSDNADGIKTPSCKGICSDTSITIYGGNIEVTTFDDAVHSKGDVAFLGGYSILTSGKMAIDGEAEVTIADGTLEKHEK